MRITIWDPSRKVSHLSKVAWSRKIIRVHHIYQFHQNSLASPSDGKSAKTNTLADGLINRTLSMLGEIESTTVHKDTEGDQ